MALLIISSMKVSVVYSFRVILYSIALNKLSINNRLLPPVQRTPFLNVRVYFWYLPHTDYFTWGLPQSFFIVKKKTHPSCSCSLIKSECDHLPSNTMFLHWCLKSSSVLVIVFLRTLGVHHQWSFYSHDKESIFCIHIGTF